MTLIKIKEAIIAVLKTNFPNITVPPPDVEEGFGKPSFFVEMLPITREKEGKYHYFRKVVIIIRYFPENETELENLEMQDKLEEIFSQVLQVGDRIITIDSLESEIVDKTLQFQFGISYIDGLEEDEIYGYEEMEKMQELILKE